MRLASTKTLVAGSVVMLAVVALLTATVGSSAQREWPLKTVPQDVIEDGGTRFEALPDDYQPATSAAQAERAVLERNPGATLRETVLVSVSSVGPSRGGDDGTDSRVVWAVSILPVEGPVCRGCAASARDEAIRNVTGKGPLEVEAEPLTDDENQRVIVETQRIVAAYLETLDDPYHVEFVDATTGEVAFGYSGWGSRK
jgi:hypothetical protein